MWVLYAFGSAFFAGITSILAKCCLLYTSNPATSTHRQMNDEQLKEAGEPAELIRISLGLEDKVDLIADISNALDAIK